METNSIFLYHRSTSTYKVVFVPGCSIVKWCIINTYFQFLNVLIAAVWILWSQCHSSDCKLNLKQDLPPLQPEPSAPSWKFCGSWCVRWRCAISFPVCCHFLPLPLVSHSLHPAMRIKKTHKPVNMPTNVDEIICGTTAELALRPDLVAPKTSLDESGQDKHSLAYFL